MKTTKKENYLILEDEKNNVKNFASYIYKRLNNFKNKNLVIDISKYGKLTLKELLEFLSVSDKHRSKKNTFVIVNDAINIDDVPNELMVVPTLQEAEDVVQMEEIQRDLGFW